MQRPGRVRNGHPAGRVVRGVRRPRGAPVGGDRRRVHPPVPRSGHAQVCELQGPHLSDTGDVQLLRGRGLCLARGPPPPRIWRLQRPLLPPARRRHDLHRPGARKLHPRHRGPRGQAGIPRGPGHRQGGGVGGGPPRRGQGERRGAASGVRGFRREAVPHGSALQPARGALSRDAPVRRDRYGYARPDDRDLRADAARRPHGDRHAGQGL
mmetsp:Transcript_31040/g.99098  ORF Transcript_31040/g.99098 Transcript_31040/m.99098 type:complete len:210 (+) Transcript_31040:153-782(+)